MVIDRAPRRIIRESAIVFFTNLVSRSAGVAASLPAPTDSRSIVVNGPDPYRILFVGSGIVVGSGIASHALGAGGHLARYVSAETGRGVNLDVVPLPSLLLRFAPTHLSRLDVAAYDAVILAAGVNDAFGITPLQKWHRSLAATLRLLKTSLPTSRQIFLLLIADPTPSPVFRHRPAQRASRRAEVFNSASSRLAVGHPDVTVIGFEIGPAADTPRLYDSGSYLGWARQMAPPVVEGLARIRPIP